MQKLDPNIDGSTARIVEENIDKLRDLFPEAFTESSSEEGRRWKVDLDVLREILGEYAEDQQERYSFTWNGKSRARRIAQTPSTGTLRPCPEESVNWETTKNLFIEGDNLEVLKLLQKSFHRKIKMIYIDPPYNTGGEFIYPDKFADNLDTYLRYTGQADEEGLKLTANAETSGRYHTNWLNMMLPRLKLARNLLRDDGVIFVSIDDIEMANLLKLCSEIFGDENHVATIVWQKRYVSNVTAKWLSDMHDFVLMFARNRDSLAVNSWKRSEQQLQAYRNPDNDPRGSWRAQDLSASKPYSAGQFTITGPTGSQFNPPPNRYWRCNEEQFNKWKAEDRIWWGINNDARPMLKSFLSESERGITPHTWWDYNFAGHNKAATLELKSLFEGDSPFDTPKPVKLMRRLIELVCADRDIVFDFFSGSSPLAQAALEWNVANDGHLRFIMAQLPEQTDRLDYTTITSIAKERIRRVITQLVSDQSAKSEAQEERLPGIEEKLTETDFGFKVFKLDASNIKPWDTEFDKLETSLLDSVENVKPDRSEDDVLYELLLKFGLDLAVPITNREIAGETVYVIGAGALIVCLANEVGLKTVEGIAALNDELKPDVMKVVFKDTGFADDVVKTNAVQILRQAGIENVRSL